MTLKRLLMPMLLVGIIVAMGGVATAQNVVCGLTTAGGTGTNVAAVPGTINPTATAPAMLGPTANGSNAGHTEPAGAGPTGIPDGAGTGRIRVSCTNSNPAATSTTTGGAPGPSTTTAQPGVVALTVNFGVPITSNTGTGSSSHPPNAQIRLANGTGDFATTGGTQNVSINLLTASSGTLVIALGQCGAVGAPPGPCGLGASPSTGITFSGLNANPPAPAAPQCTTIQNCQVTSTFEIEGVLLSTNGKSGAINASLTSSGGIGVAAGSLATCSTSVGPCATVITNVQAGLADPNIPTGSLPSAVTGQTNLGTTAIAGGAAVLTSSGGAVKSNFTIRIQENYADLFKSFAQFNGGAVFPLSPASSVQVNIALSNIPTGFDISGCSAVLTDVNGNSPAAGFLGSSGNGQPSVSATNFTAASPVLTVLFPGNVDPNNVDVLWVTCTKVAVGSSTLPLPSTSITAQVYLGPVGSSSFANGLTTGQIPRYQQLLVPSTPLTVVVFPPSNTTLLVSFAFVGTGYNTGLSLANTTVDPFTPTAGGLPASSGTVTFLMVNNNGTSKSYTTTTGSPGSGLTGAGVVASGSTYVVNLSEILTAANFGSSFTGYIFISANFIGAHGAATIYTTSNGAAALSSPVLVVSAGSPAGGISSANPRNSPEGFGQ
jgi:hypothetical protein